MFNCCHPFNSNSKARNKTTETDTQTDIQHRTMNTDRQTENIP